MNQARRILPVKIPGKFKKIPASERLISTGPDQYSRVVFISLIHRLSPIQKHRKPLWMIARNYIVHVLCSVKIGIPGSMRFQVVFIHHVNSIPVTQTVHGRIIGIVAHAKGVDIMTLKVQNVRQHFLFRNGASEQRRKLVAVYPVEYNPSSVNTHNMIVAERKLPKADILADKAAGPAVRVQKLYPERIQVGFLSAPKSRVIDGKTARNLGG